MSIVEAILATQDERGETIRLEGQTVVLVCKNREAAKKLHDVLLEEITVAELQDDE
jgi:hypothetical protein